MKYLILIYSNPDSRQTWEGFSPEEQAEGFRYYAALTEELAASGELVLSEALDPSSVKRVRVRDGRAVTTDGPFAEAKELLMGIYVVQCDSMDRAITIAARMPEAEYGLIEVRPIMDLSEPV